eukprot:Rhum_TRINITY_DN11068_c0_g1::Rhum_TRINITY_DN11068_c0_g1_i1::g.42214::m.42214
MHAAECPPPPLSRFAPQRFEGAVVRVPHHRWYPRTFLRRTCVPCVSENTVVVSVVCKVARSLSIVIDHVHSSSAAAIHERVDRAFVFVQHRQVQRRVSVLVWHHFAGAGAFVTAVSRLGSAQLLDNFEGAARGGDVQRGASVLILAPQHVVVLFVRQNALRRQAPVLQQRLHGSGSVGLCSDVQRRLPRAVASLDVRLGKARLVQRITAGTGDYLTLCVVVHHDTVHVAHCVHVRVAQQRDEAGRRVLRGKVQHGAALVRLPAHARTVPLAQARDDLRVAAGYGVEERRLRQTDKVVPLRPLVHRVQEELDEGPGTALSRHVQRRHAVRKRVRVGTLVQEHVRDTRLRGKVEGRAAVLVAGVHLRARV